MKGSHGCVVYYRSTSVPYHLRNGVFADEQYTLKIEVDGSIPVFNGDLQTGSPRGTTNIVEQYVQSTVLGDCCLYQSLGVWLLGNICLYRYGIATLFPNYSHRFLSSIQIAVNGGYSCPFPGKEDCGRFSVPHPRSY